MLCTECGTNMNKEAEQTFPYDYIKRIWWKCPKCFKHELEIIQYGHYN